MNLFNPEKFIKLDISPTIGENAFILLGSFKKTAQAYGWSSEDIEKVLTQAKSGNYENLIEVLQSHCID